MDLQAVNHVHTMEELALDEEEAAAENDEAWEEEVAEKEKNRKAIDKVEAETALQQLLNKAEQYTRFLNRKMISATDMSKSKTNKKKNSGEEEENMRKKRKGQNGKRVESNQEDNDDDEPKQPETLTGGKLREYQTAGYKWMVGLYENGLHGILADEMGLGKTVQTIALIAHLREKGCYGPFLLVVPLSTATNWVAEIEKWCPSMPALLYHGTKEERAELRKEYFNLSLKRNGKRKPMTLAMMKNFPVTVTTYEILCRDRPELQKCGWKHVIVDEGHRLKNFNCRLIRELNMICGGSVMQGGANKILLTGTPLQNNLAELWSLLNFLMPEIFDNLEFFESVFSFDSSSEDAFMQKHAEENIVSKLHTILAPFMMRRLKSEVEKDMPEKKEVVLYVNMAKDQREMYESIVKGELAKLLQSVTGSKKQLNNMLMQLRKCCLHPYLHYEAENEQGGLTTDQSIIDASGKMQVLDQMLTNLKKNGHKTLIFSQFTSMLDIIQDYLEVLRPNWKFCRIDGTTKIDERKQQMHDFNQDPEYFVFLLSTRAGGVGINLMAADTVIIFDSDFNPHQDNQAQDRAHRIGQKKDVMVYRLVTANSVELRVLEIANAKRKLERVVCAKNTTSSSSTSSKKQLGVDELRRLLEDDFTGFNANDKKDVKLTKDTINMLLDRKGIIQGDIPEKGRGYEIVENKATNIVGAVN